VHSPTMTGRIRLGHSGGGGHYHPELAVAPQIYSVSDSQALSEASSDHRPPQGNRVAWLSRQRTSHTDIGTPPRISMF